MFITPKFLIFTPKPPKGGLRSFSVVAPLQGGWGVKNRGLKVKISDLFLKKISLKNLL